MQNFNYFQHDGAPAHNSRTVCDSLAKRFPSSPARSPDLTPRGTLKYKVYTKKPDNIEDLKNNIIMAIQSISQHSLVQVHNNIIKRYRMCSQANGYHFEHNYFYTLLYYKLSF